MLQLAISAPTPPEGGFSTKDYTIPSPPLRFIPSNLYKDFIFVT
jgi:hypothetical protein